MELEIAKHGSLGGEWWQVALVLVVAVVVGWFALRPPEPRRFSRAVVKRQVRYQRRLR